MTEVDPQWKTFKPPKRSGADPAWTTARECRLWFDRWRCVVALPGCEGAAVHVHHRRREDRKTGDHDQARLVSACNACHDRIHRNVDWAVRHGWLLRSNTEGPFLAGCALTCEDNHFP